MEGKIIIIVENSPFAIVLPAVLADFINPVSDNYIYTLANDNLDIDFGDGFLAWLGGKVSALGRHFVDFFGGSLGEHWTSGLITLWNEDGEFAHRGSYYSDTGFLNFDNVYIDVEDKTLVMKKGIKGEKTKYKLEGWAGRYGMPMEFLLSVHLATLMPDLSFEMANTFETKLNIILHSYGDSYSPYIENVINHWYRNVYFTSTSYNEENEKDGNSITFVDYDYEYEDVMRERWTLYETDEKGDYVLYVLRDSLDGEYATSGADVDSYKSSKIQKEDNYYIFKGTLEEAEEENVKVAKKAITVSSDDEGVLEDIEWKRYGDVWAAYEESGSSINQKGDAQRGETNAKIKKMFLENTYFRYDGSPEVAEAITKFRNQYGMDYGPINQKFDPEKDDLASKTVKVNTESGTRSYSLEDVTGKVVLNQDSLNAFTMLENTPTLDSDYIYRDFKELIVELGYFSKDELTNETPKLLAWIIPEIGSHGFPKRTLDKVENEFGTMAHSKLDYYAAEKALYWNENNEPTNEKDISSDAEKDSKKVAITDYFQSVSGKKRNLLGCVNGEPTVTDDFMAAEMDDIDMVVRSWGEKFNKMTASQYYEQGNEEQYIKWLNSLGGVFSEYAGEDVQGDGDGDSFVDAEKYVYGLMWIAGFEYCAGTADTEPERCDPIMDEWFEAGTNKYDAYYGYPGVGHSHIDCADGPDEVGSVHIDKAMLEHKFTTNCNYTTDKVYYKAGLFGNGDDSRPVSSCDYEGLVNDYGAKIVTEASELKLGDLIECFDVDNHTDPDPSHWEGWSHVFFVGEEHEDTLGLYTTGHDFTNAGNFRREISKTASRGEVYGGGWVGLHLWDLKVDNEKYEGYRGNEAVVSPVTGILLDYGTYAESDDERINVDLKYDHYLAEVQAKGIDVKYAIPRQEYKEQFGYAKIMVLNAENYKKLESAVNSRWKSDSLVVKDTSNGKYKFIDKLTCTDDLKEWSIQDKTIYGYKEFLEKYEDYGIAGNIVYIDGFRCETVDKGFHDAEGVYPEGEAIELSNFQVSPDALGGEDEYAKSKYKKDSKYHTVSKKVEDRINAEAKVKKEASPCVSANNLTFIKEGTILGRTITDRELIEKDRNNELGTYEELRKIEIDEVSDYKVIGNYIRMIMRESDTDTVVENIEDYMKLDDGLKDKNKNKDLRIVDDFDVTDETNFPELDDFKKMFADCPNILANAEAFIEMQEKYKINAAFAACVTIIESSGGTAWAAIDPSTHNWFSIRGDYKGSSIGGWRCYPSFAVAVDDFGDLIRNSTYYVGAGKKTVNQIGPVYCDEVWSEAVNKEMRSRYQKVLGGS